MAKFTLLLHLSLVVALAASSNANSFGPHRRDHADLGRLVKKRALESPSTAPPILPSQSTSAVAQTTPATVQTTSVSSSAVASTSSSTTSGGGLLGSVVSTLLPSQSSTAPSSSSAPASSLAPSQSSSVQTPAQASNSAEPPTQSTMQSIMFLTTSHAAPAPTQTSTTTSSSSGMSHAAVTILIVIAATVGASVIVWTIIRKWKFRPSSDFEGRMQPIDWQPDGINDDGGLPVQRSLSRASSFHSGSASDHVDEQARGYGGNPPPLNPIPDHDFTAGPAHLAPVGGYADLARGPSPQPVMQEPLRRAPTINKPAQYDQYGVPLHHGYTGY